MKRTIFMPAYNAEKTLEAVVRKIPPGSCDEILLLDDLSRDRTLEVARGLGLTAFRNSRNLGYGGNLKKGLALALERGADAVAELHPDDEYDPSSVPQAFEEIAKGADLVLGNRFTGWFTAVQSGMRVWKYLPSRVLSVLESPLLGVRVHDLHQGFRVYSRRLLQAVPFLENSNSYLFSFEIIVQACRLGMNVAEVPVRCSYTGKKRGASLSHSWKYSLGTFLVLGRHLRRGTARR